MLVGLCPIPFRSASCDAGYAFVPNTSITKKDSLGLFHKGRILGYLRLSGLHFFSATLFLCKEQFYIFLCTKKFLHFFFRFTIIQVYCFLFCQQLGIFRVQLLDRGEFFLVSFIKRRFRCLVQRDLRAVRFQKALAVSGLAVGIIYRSRFGVVDDMRFQHRDFCQPLL